MLNALRIEWKDSNINSRGIPSECTAVFGERGIRIECGTQSNEPSQNSVPRQVWVSGKAAAFSVIFGRANEPSIQSYTKSSGSGLLSYLRGLSKLKGIPKSFDGILLAYSTAPGSDGLIDGVEWAEWLGARCVHVKTVDTVIKNPARRPIISYYFSSASLDRLVGTTIDYKELRGPNQDKFEITEAYYTDADLSRLHFPKRIKHYAARTKDAPPQLMYAAEIVRVSTVAPDATTFELASFGLPDPDRTGILPSSGWSLLAWLFLIAAVFGGLAVAFLRAARMWKERSPNRLQER